MYLIKKDLDLSKLTFSDREVDEVRYIDIPEFKKWVEEKRNDLVMHTDEYRQLFAYIG